MNILYIHGLESKLSLEKRIILEEFGNVIAPNLDYFNYENTIQEVFDSYQNQSIDVIIGSSMGGFVGFYLSQMMQKQAFLFNPALKERPVIQIIPADFDYKVTDITILLGEKDDVVPNEKTYDFLRTHVMKSKPTILINSEMGHGVPISVFKNELSTYLSKIKNV